MKYGKQYGQFVAMVTLTLLMGTTTVGAPLSWVTIYEEDFSVGATGWETNSSGDYHWTADEGGAFQYHQVDSSGGYAFVPVGYTDGQDFKLEFDINMISTTGAGNHVFGLFDPGMDIFHGTTQHLVADGGGSSDHVSLLTRDDGGSVHSYPTSYVGWTHHTWYEAEIIYDAGLDETSIHLSERDSGTVLLSGSATGLGSFTGMDRLAVSIIGDAGSPTWTATGLIDNVRFSVPEPSTLSLAALSGLVLLRRR